MKQQAIVTNIILGLIITLSLFLHTFKILDNPPALYSDENDISYQASIFNLCHSDYFGNKFPIHFHSFADWQPGLYIYSVAFVQKFIGHTDLAARLPAAIWGTLTVFLFYLVIKKILKNSIWALIGAFLITISPWLMHYSRTGFAVTSMLFFLLLGIYFWLQFIDSSKNRHLFLSIASFTTLLYTYSTAKLHLVFIFLTLLIFWYKKIISIPVKTKLIGIILIILISLPIIFDTFQGKAGYRFSYINIFTDPTVSDAVNISRLEDSQMIFGQQIGLKTTITSKIFYNKITQWSSMFFKNYFKSFSTEFLFLNGDGNLRQGFQTAGYLLYPDLLFFIIGLAVIFKKRKNDKNQKIYSFFALNLILSPIPFALTRDSNFAHGTRLIFMLPFLIFFSLMGIKQIISQFRLNNIALPFILIIYTVCFAGFYHQYFYHYPNISARSWHTGMKEAVLTSVQYQDQWNKIYFSNSYEPFMPFFLNYSNYQPNGDYKCSPALSLTWDNTNYFTGMQAQNKFYLGTIEWSPLLVSKPAENSLFVINQEDLIKAQKSVDEYNKSNPKHVNLIINKEINKKFTEQEKFSFISFHYDK